MRESGQLLVGPEKVPRPEKGLKGGISWKLGSPRWRHLGEAEKIKSKCKIFFLEAGKLGGCMGNKGKAEKMRWLINYPKS